jgi:hypothetical protein
MWFLSNIIVNIFNYYNQLFTIWLYAYQTRKNHQDQTLSGGEGEGERESATTDSRERTSIVGTYNRERKRDEMMRFMGKDG